MSVRCFFLEPTDKEKRWLRRYHCSGGLADKDLPECVAPGNHGYHQAWVELDVITSELKDGCVGREFSREDAVALLRNSDAPWPQFCPCLYKFQEDDQWQVFTSLLYKRSDNGEVISLRDAGPGAMWYATWLPKNMYWDNKEDESLCVRLPDGTDWVVDSRCSNCTLPVDRTHRCWVRSGEPPNVTVGKDGYTCSAGAGSILSPNWHGFLRNGVLSE